MKYFSLFVITFFILLNNVFTQSSKIEKWKNPSFFRGYNLLANEDKTYKDFEDLRQTGANFVYIGIDGFYSTDEPYERSAETVALVQSMILKARKAGLYYAITVRSGPGRRDVYLESIKEPKSTIWTNSEEQMLYAKMIKEIAEKYMYDSLLVGIAPIMEPNPLFDQLYPTPKYLDSILKFNKIDVQGFNKMIIDSVRKVNKNIPIILQSVAYSCPEFISLIGEYNDTNIVYEFHSYRPSEYVNDTATNSRKYPDYYISFYNLAIKLHDKQYFEDSIYSRVKTLKKNTGVPIILGEFGLCRAQINGPQFVKDISDICLEEGWHFAYWDWRTHANSWNFESFGTDYMDVVRESFLTKTNVNELQSGSLKISFSDEILVVSSNKTFRDINLFDLLGQKQILKDNKVSSGGNNELSYINISNLKPGFYIMQISFGAESEFLKILYENNKIMINSNKLYSIP